MNGLMITNGFLNNKKFGSVYSLLKSAADRNSIRLDCIQSSELPHSPEKLRGLPYDFILFWDKDVILAEMLELCGYRVFNSSAAIAACDSKAETFIRLSGTDLNIPQTFAAPLTFEGVGYSDISFAEKYAEELHYPLVLKENYGSFGKQVYLIMNHTELAGVIGSLGSKGFIMQKFIESSAGRDVRLNVIGDRVVSSMLRRSRNGDFRSNISNGGTASAFEANDEWKAAAVAASRALGADFSGVDIMFGSNGEPIVCEVNSNPHFKSSLDCTGVDMGVEIFKYIRERLN